MTDIDTELAEHRRAVEALRSGLRAQAERPAFRPLDVTGLIDGSTRPRRRGPWVGVAVAAVALVVAAALILPRLGGPAIPAAPASTETWAPREYGVWLKVAASPLSPRWEAFGIWVDGRYLVFSGHSDFLCPPGADCKIPQWLTDGALYDPDADAWTTIAPMPAAVHLGSPVALGSSVYLLSWGTGGTPPTLLRYDTLANAWTSRAVPGGLNGALVATDSRVVILSDTDEFGAVADQVYDPETGEFSALPEDPLGPSFNRSAVWTGDQLLLSAHDLVDNPGSEEPSLMRLAALDADLATWHEIGTSQILGVGSAGVSASGRVVWTALGSADGGEINNWGRFYPFGGIFDPGTDTWTDLPTPPAEGPLPGEAMVAAGRVEVGGQLLDPVALTWAKVPALPTPNTAGAAMIGGPSGVLVWGGGDYDTPTADGYLLWVPPLSRTPTPVASPTAGSPGGPGASPTPDVPIPTLEGPTPTPAPETASAPPPTVPPTPDAPSDPPSTR